MQTIQGVAKAQQVTDRTVRNWLAAARQDGKTLGTMRKNKLHFSAEEVDILVSYGRNGEDEPVAIDAEIVPDGFFRNTTVDPTDHRPAVLPEGFDPAAMVRFFDGVAGASTDTSSLVAVAKMAIEAADTAMQSKVAGQRKALAQAEQDQAALARMLAEAKVKMQVTALESRMLAERQTAATVGTESGFQELMGMGKPQPQSQTDGLS